MTLKPRRRRSLDTVGVYDTTRWGPFLLMRVMSPIGDPYERRYNPHVSLRPWAFEIRHHRRGE
jgi:hypothetical protein